MALIKHAQYGFVDGVESDWVSWIDNPKFDNHTWQARGARYHAEDGWLELGKEEIRAYDRMLMTHTPEIKRVIMVEGPSNE